MKQKPPSLLKLLKLYYLLIFILTFILVLPAHLFPLPFFMPLRFPHYLEIMGTILGISWPMSFEIYHYALYALALVGSLNILGIISYPKLRYAALFSSLIGIFLISLMVLFFFFIFIRVNVLTAIIYGQYCVILLTIDILTFKTLLRKPKPSLT